MTSQPQTLVPVFTVGDRLRKARELTGMDQSEFADTLGISRGSVSNYERGGVTPRPIVLRAWSMATGVPLVWLETGEEPTRPTGPDGPSTTPEDQLAALAARKRARHAGARTSERYAEAA